MKRKTVNRLNDLEYLKLNKFEAFLYNLKLFFFAIPTFFKNLGLKIVDFFKTCGLGIKNEFVDIGTTFRDGNWAVKLSFFVFGVGNLYYGQILRGLLLQIFEIVFI